MQEILFYGYSVLEARTMYKRLLEVIVINACYWLVQSPPVNHRYFSNFNIALKKADHYRKTRPKHIGALLSNGYSMDSFFIMPLSNAEIHSLLN